MSGETVRALALVHGIEINHVIEFQVRIVSFAEKRIHIVGQNGKYPECADNQNYNSANPEFRIVVSKKEAYHQFGNSVAVPVIKRLAQEIVNQLLNKS